VQVVALVMPRVIPRPSAGLECEDPCPRSVERPTELGGNTDEPSSLEYRIQCAPFEWNCYVNGDRSLERLVGFDRAAPRCAPLRLASSRRMLGKFGKCRRLEWWGAWILVLPSNPSRTSRWSGRAEQRRL